MATHRQQDRSLTPLTEVSGLNLRVDPAGSITIDLESYVHGQKLRVPLLEQSGKLASTPSTASTPNREPPLAVQPTGGDVDVNPGTDQGYKTSPPYCLRQSAGGF